MPYTRKLFAVTGEGEDLIEPDAPCFRIEIPMAAAGYVFTTEHPMAPCGSMFGDRAMIIPYWLVGESRDKSIANA